VTPSSDVDVDVAVIGAGIHGAGMAQAAAAAGHSVLLLEQSAPAAGSSSRSSKLIHGGLRYLETGQLHLVRESLHERTTLLRLAPSLVRLQRFYIPIYRETRRRPWQLTIGLSLYAVLAGMQRGAGFGRLPRREWPTLDGLELQSLEHVYYYHDAQTDDAALTEAVLRSSEQLGAQMLCPAQCLGATLQQDAVQLRYRHAGREQYCRARVLVNAAGPWAQQLAQRITPAITVPPLECVQGTHLVLDCDAPQRCYYVESPRDGRAVFVLPWKQKLMIGTTEGRFRGDPAQVAPTPAEEHYLLGVLKHYFPRFRAPAAAPILQRFAGLRVLPKGEGHAFHRSRETLLSCDRPAKPRVLTIYGGKLTTWRAVSQRALALIAASLPKRTARARTDQLPLGDQRGDQLGNQ
jgi:glycerol-3-phosphate dehydrogenase